VRYRYFFIGGTGAIFFLVVHLYKKKKIYTIYDPVECLEYQKRALKSSEQVKNAAEFGECTIERIGPLWPTK